MNQQIQATPSPKLSQGNYASTYESADLRQTTVGLIAPIDHTLNTCHGSGITPKDMYYPPDPDWQLGGRRKGITY